MTRREKILLACIGFWVIILLFCVGSGIRLRSRLDEHKKLLKNANNELFVTQQDVGEEMKKVLELNETLEFMSDNLDKANKTIVDLKNAQYKLVYLGDFKITHYCVELRPHICGTGTGITASGTQVTAGRTVAVDPKIIPYGTKLYIEGYGWRIAEDCGGSVKNAQIDVAVDTHADALAMGVNSGGVWILVETKP